MTALNTPQRAYYQGLLTGLARQTLIAQANVQRNLDSIHARLEEYSRDPFIATYYQFNKIDMAGDFSGLGERIFNREEIEHIIYQSAIITRKSLLIYYPTEEPRHRDLEVSPTFGRDQAVSMI